MTSRYQRTAQGPADKAGTTGNENVHVLPPLLTRLRAAWLGRPHAQRALSHRGLVLLCAGIGVATIADQRGHGAGGSTPIALTGACTGPMVVELAPNGGGESAITATQVNTAIGAVAAHVFGASAATLDILQPPTLWDSSLTRGAPGSWGVSAGGMPGTNVAFIDLEIRRNKLTCAQAYVVENTSALPTVFTKEMSCGMPGNRVSSTMAGNSEPTQASARIAGDKDDLSSFTDDINWALRAHDFSHPAAKNHQSINFGSTNGSLSITATTKPGSADAKAWACNNVSKQPAQP